MNPYICLFGLLICLSFDRFVCHNFLKRKENFPSIGALLCSPLVPNTKIATGHRACGAPSMTRYPTSATTRSTPPSPSPRMGSPTHNPSMLLRYFYYEWDAQTDVRTDEVREGDGIEIGYASKKDFVCQLS